MPAFPTLAYFAVWNRSLATGQRDEEGEEDAGLLFFSTKLDFTAFRRARKVGLAQGLVDFTRMLSSPQEKLKAVHSSQQRMLFYEPEDGYLLHAAIDLARLPNKDKSHARSNSQSSERSNTATGTPNDEGLEDEALLAGLRELYEHFKILHGSFASILAEAGREELSSKLSAYFDEAIWHWQLERAVLGSCDFAGVLGALRISPAHAAVDALPAVQALSEQCILLDYEEVLHLPSATESTALTRHLLQKQPKRPKDKPPDDATVKPAAAAPSTASKWTLGLSEYLTPAPKGEKEKVEPAQVDQSQSRSWLRAVSWSSSKRVSIDEKGEDAQLAVDDADSDDSSIAEHIARQATADSSSESLAEELLAEPLAVEEEPKVEMPASASPFQPPLRVFVGDKWTNVHVLQRDALLLAILGDSPPAGLTALELLMSVEDCVRSFQISPPPSTYRHLLFDHSRALQRSQDWPSKEESWSGNKRSAKEADVVGSLLDFAGSPDIDEALIRTGSGQWAAARRTSDLESYLVLPRRFGRDAAEGSLLDAAHELNAKLGRAVL